jgi:hypothetical protein
MALSAHMGKPSMMMMGSKMSTEVDAGGGRVIGSKIRMRGSVMGIPVSLEEVVTERQAPNIKLWETIGNPRLLVLAHYRMGLTAPESWLGSLFGAVYARWCTKWMANDAAEHFVSIPAECA